MKYLIINSTAGFGSTGRIAADQCRQLIAEGHECVLAYGRMITNCDDIPTHRIGSSFNYHLHGIMTRLFDLNGFCSKRATEEFLAWVRTFNPDYIWLHNVHGYYINVEMLFDYLKTCGKPIKWTLHDCWAFTGHCAYFTFTGCNQWMTGCEHCVDLHSYPSCYGFSDVRGNYVRKRTSFTRVPNMSIVVPSKWLGRLVQQSYLQEYPVEVIYNKIDTDIFKVTPSDLRNRCGLQDKIIVLGVASYWTERKGLLDYYRLAQMLDEHYAMVLVGLSPGQMKELPDRIQGIRPMDSPIEGTVVYAPLHTSPCSNARDVIGIHSNHVVTQSPDAVYQAITGHAYEEERNHGGCSRLICMPRTNSPQELAAIYTAADVFINMTYEDNYPTVNLEAQACGTYVITYDTGGCAETLEYHNIQ